MVAETLAKHEVGIKNHRALQPAPTHVLRYVCLFESSDRLLTSSSTVSMDTFRLCHGSSFTAPRAAASDELVDNGVRHRRCSSDCRCHT